MAENCFLAQAQQLSSGQSDGDNPSSETDSLSDDSRLCQDDT